MAAHWAAWGILLGILLVIVLANGFWELLP
jgi:hypothetical protein